MFPQKPVTFQSDRTSGHRREHKIIIGADGIGLREDIKLTNHTVHIVRVVPVLCGQHLVLGAVMATSRSLVYSSRLFFSACIFGLYSSGRFQ